MEVNTSLPSNFSKYTLLEPAKNLRFIIGAIGAGIASLLLFGWLLVLFTNFLRPAALDSVRLRYLIRSTPTVTALDIPFALFRDFFFALVAMMIVHELVHGLFYWLFSRKRPKFGFHGLFPYAAAPTGVYFPRNQFLVVGLAPLVLLTIVGLLLVVIVPIPLVPFLLFLVAFNAAGAAGDVIMAMQLMSFPSETVMEDNDAGVTIYGPKR